MKLVCLAMAILLTAFGIAFIVGSEKIYDLIESYRDRHPIIRVFNPFARYNTPMISRINAIIFGLGCLLAAVLMWVGFFWGEFPG